MLATAERGKPPVTFPGVAVGAKPLACEFKGRYDSLGLSIACSPLANVQDLFGKQPAGFLAVVVHIQRFALFIYLDVFDRAIRPTSTVTLVFL